MEDRLGEQELANNTNRIVHWYRKIFNHVPSTKVREIAAMRSMRARTSWRHAKRLSEWIEKLRALRLIRAAELVEAAVDETPITPFLRSIGGASAPTIRSSAS